MNKLNWNIEEKQKWLFITFVFGLYFVLACYKLTNASLWLDETVEFYYSKIMFGITPDSQIRTNMYQRIISTFQPPLYNLVMFFWLKLGESEWWFRFFGVVMGFIGAIGLYKTINKLTNFSTAIISVIIYSFTYRLIYYIQECAEYNLMLALLFWTFYFYISVLENINLKNIILFTIFSILPVYTQYGSIFIIFILCISVLIKVLINRDWINVKKLVVSYFVAFILAALPLYFLFLRHQMAHQLQLGMRQEIQFSGLNITISDFINNFINVFKWNMIAHTDKSSNIAIKILLFLFIVICSFCFKYSKNKKIVRPILLSNLLIWCIFYFAVKIKLYSGSFGNRYNLFFVPMWILTIILIIYEFIICIQNFNNKKMLIFSEAIKGFSILLLVCFCFNGWNVIKNNWSKENIRDVTNNWYQEEGYKSNTMIYYASNTGFSYYLENNDKYKEEYKNNIVFQEPMRGKLKEEYEDIFLKMFNNNLPNELFICASHYISDLETMLQVFYDYGYNVDILYDNNGKLIKVYI